MRSIYFFILLFFGGCLHRTPGVVNAYPADFVARIPFQINNKGIIIATYWGSERKEYNLYLDNHSPSWINNAVISNNVSVSKSPDFLYSTTTADGKTISGDVYICDSIRLGTVNFKHVAFYNISNAANKEKTDGAIGENIMSAAIWKIDFRTRTLTIASSIDSITGLQDCRLIPAAFTENGIEISVRFGHNIQKKMELDLGYNGCFIMPIAEFIPVTRTGMKPVKQIRRFSTPAGSDLIEDLTATDTIQIGDRQYQMQVSSNTQVKENLIGYGFFSQFACLVIDFKNKALYLSARPLTAE